MGGTDGKIFQYASAEESWDTGAYKYALMITTKDDAPPIKRLYTVAVGGGYVSASEVYNTCLNFVDGVVLDKLLYISNSNVSSIEPINEHTIRLYSSRRLAYKFDFCLIVYTS